MEHPGGWRDPVRLFEVIPMRNVIIGLAALVASVAGVRAFVFTFG